MVAIRNINVSLGQIVSTPRALEAINDSEQTPGEFLNRHKKGDWGDVSEEDWQSNDNAIEEELRLLSAYKTHMGVKLWIITEADRSATTILLPEDY